MARAALELGERRAERGAVRRELRPQRPSLTVRRAASADGWVQTRSKVVACQVWQHGARHAEEMVGTRAVTRGAGHERVHRSRHCVGRTCNGERAAHHGQIRRAWETSAVLKDALLFAERHVGRQRALAQNRVQFCVAPVEARRTDTAPEAEKGSVDVQRGPPARVSGRPRRARKLRVAEYHTAVGLLAKHGVKSLAR